MMTAFSLLWSMRRALARISVTVVPGVSSIKISRRPSSLMASLMLAHSSGEMRPVRKLDMFTMAWAQMKRCAISLPDISREKKPTVYPSAAALRARFKANEVLPTAGRAPITTSWPSRRPMSMRSSVG
ncbi:Uncharacterised protein [Collinsella intestinalis]|nr:Uncharacterised protein [Collinsella intestinalis]